MPSLITNASFGLIEATMVFMEIGRPQVIQFASAMGYWLGYFAYMHSLDQHSTTDVKNTFRIHYRCGERKVRSCTCITCSKNTQGKYSSNNECKVGSEIFGFMLGFERVSAIWCLGIALFHIMLGLILRIPDIDVYIRLIVAVVTMLSGTMFLIVMDIKPLLKEWEDNFDAAKSLNCLKRIRIRMIETMRAVAAEKNVDNAG